MIPLIIGGIVILAATAAVVTYIEEIKKWVLRIKKTIEFSIHVIKVFLTKTAEGIEEIVRYESKDSWNRKIITRKKQENEVPEEILDKLKTNKTINITDQMELRN